MMFFDNTYHVDLEISQRRFIDGLIKITEMRSELILDTFPNKRKEFLGRIEFNSFKILQNKSSLFGNRLIINGQLYEKDDKVQITGSILGYKFYLIKYIFFTLISLILLIYNLLNDSETSILIILSVFSLFGIIKFFGGIHYLLKFKKRITEKLKCIAY